MTKAYCSSCGAESRGKFCPSCGKAVEATGGMTTWHLGAIALMVTVAFALGVLVGRDRTPPTPAAAATPPVPGVAAGPSGPAPDISSMTPRERFDRLYEKVMGASSAGDGATLQRFAPMAIAAYGMLDSVDIDAQYDVALLKLHTGDITGARALGDSIVRKAPTHLFGQMLRATIARFQGDSAEARSAQAAFLRNYPEEMRRGRPEYEKHRSAIEAFKAQVTSKPSPAL